MSDIAVTGESVKDNKEALKNALGSNQKQGAEVQPAPAPELTIKDKSNGGEQVRKFVAANVEDIQDAYDFTTIFIDTDREYKKFGVEVPSVALICTDLRKTVASLKRDTLVTKFNKSKTLKRVKEWAKGKVEGFEKVVWFTIYSSAKAFNALTEGVEDKADLTYLGYINEDGTIAVCPGKGETIFIGDRLMPIVEAEDCIVVKNGSYEFRLDESEVSEDVILEESTMDGEFVGDYTVMGLYEGCVVLADSNDICYLYEAGLDVVSNGVQEGALVLSVNGKTYKYTSDQYSANELEEKFNGIGKHSIGRALAWIKKNAVTQDSYAKPTFRLKSKGVKGDKFVVEINGKVYNYSSEKYTAKELENQFNSMTKHKGAEGKALAWLKKNAITSDSYRKVNESEDSEINEASDGWFDLTEKAAKIIEKELPEDSQVDVMEIGQIEIVTSDDVDIKKVLSKLNGKYNSKVVHREDLGEGVIVVYVEIGTPEE